MAKFPGLALSFALICALAAVLPASLARADDGTAQDAARQIAAARERANAANAAYFEAQSHLDLLTDEKAKLDTEVVALQARIDALQKTVEAVAVNRYIGAGTTGIALLSGNVGPTEQAAAAVLIGIVNDASASSLDDYAELHKRLDAKKDEADRVSKAYETAQQDFMAKEKAALAEVEKLKVVEAGRLQDDAVKRALEAQRQKVAEAAQKAAEEKLKKDQAAAAAAVVQGGASDGGDAGLAPPTGNVASGSSSGGTTGGGGAGGRPVAATFAIYGQGDAWVCPLQGAPYSFSDTYGAPRSGGRLHQGVDMIAARGTQIVAVVDGVSQPGQNELGGNAISFAGNDGNRYYYAHLDSFAATGAVTKGTVIGYVGDTGDARFSTPHLHFEIHPGGGPAVNPTPTVAASC